MDIEEPTSSRGTDNPNVLVAYILNSSASLLPIKFSDMVALLDKNKEEFQRCYPLATDILRQVYGVLVKEIPDSKAGKSIICYLEDTVKSVHQLTESQKRNKTLLFLVLSYIFMKGDKILDNELEEYLKEFRINFNAPHEYFGANIKELITVTFVKQLYLEKSKSESELHHDRFVYSWGFRSLIEFNKREMLATVASIMGKPLSNLEIEYERACKAQEALWQQESQSQ